MTMDFVDLIAVHGDVTIERIEGVAKTNVENLSQANENLKQLLKEFDEAASHTTEDTRLTAEGHAERLTEVGMDYVHRLDGFDRWVEQAREQLEELRSQQRVDPTDPNAVIEFLRQQEVRNELKKKDPLDLVGIFFNAIEGGDSLTFFALRDAPPVFELLEPEVLEEGEAAWLDKRDPKAATAIKGLANAIQTITDTLASVRRHIVETAKLPEATELVAM